MKKITEDERKEYREKFLSILKECKVKDEVRKLKTEELRKKYDHKFKTIFVLEEQWLFRLIQVYCESTGITLKELINNPPKVVWECEIMPYIHGNPIGKYTDLSYYPQIKEIVISMFIASELLKYTKITKDPTRERDYYPFTFGDLDLDAILGLLKSRPLILDLKPKFELKENMNIIETWTEIEKQSLDKLYADIKEREKDFTEDPSLYHYKRLLSGMVRIEVFKEKHNRIKKPIVWYPIRKTCERKLREKFQVSDSIPVIYKSEAKEITEKTTKELVKVHPKKEVKREPKEIDWEKIKKEIIERINNSRESKIKYDVLLVNDDTATLYLIEKYFQHEGITSKFMLDGREVFKELEEYHPKVIILDDIMPNMDMIDMESHPEWWDGHYLCKQIKTNPKLKHIPVFILINSVRKFDSEADGYICYPFNYYSFNKIWELLKK